MSGKIPVSVLITTLNEEKNLPRCLAALTRFDEIVVIDSNSTDATCDIARSSGARVETFTWNNSYPKKRQWALDTLTLKHNRIFFIDADEEATTALCDEIAALDWAAPGYFVKGLYVVDGTVLKYGLHNKKLCLFDLTKIEFPVVDDLDIPGMGEIEGHYQPVLKSSASGKMPTLRNAVLHHALEDKARYRARHEGYTLWREGVEARNAHPQDPVKARQWLKAAYRRLPCKSLFFYAYYYFGRLGILERKNNLAIFTEKAKYHSR